MDKNEIFEEMIYDEDLEIKKLVSKAKKVVLIKKNTGKPILIHKNKLTNGENIGCFVLGHYFSKEAGFIDTEIVTVEDITSNLKIQGDVVRARLKDLKDKEIVECVSPGKYRISSVKLEEYLDKIIIKLNNN